MQIRTIGNGVDIDDALDTYVRRRIHFELGRFSSRVRFVSVILSDRSGPSAELGKTCRVRVVFHRLSTVVPAAVEEKADVNIRAAINRAVNGVSFRVARRLDPRVESLQGGGRPLGEEW